MIKSGNGLGNGHDFLILDVALWIEFGVSSLVTWKGIDEGAVGDVGLEGLFGNIEGGNDSRRQVCLTMTANED